jgi:hypothetical protein
MSWCVTWNLQRKRPVNINDMLAFLAVAKDRSFTKAAAKLGVSPSDWSLGLDFGC